MKRMAFVVGAAMTVTLGAASAASAATTVTVAANPVINEGVTTDLFDRAQGTTIVATSDIPTGIGGYGGASSNGVAYNAIGAPCGADGEYDCGPEGGHVIFGDGSNSTQTLTLKTATAVKIGGVNISLAGDGNLNRQFQAVALDGSSDGVNFTNLFTYSLGTGIYSSTYGSNDITVQALFSNFTGQYFRFDGTPLPTSTTNFNGGRLVELDAVAGASPPTPPPVAAAPEPASWAMMIVGFGMIGAGLRYRQRRTVLRYV